MEIEIFKNPDFGIVRTMVIENEPFFVGKDVATILGYKDTSDALKRHVDSEDKLTRCFTDSGQGREMYVINESGLYSLILSSKLPGAKSFKRWVTSEVLPSIRKHGAYATDDVINKVLESPDFGIQLLTQLKREREKVQVLGAELEQKSNLIETMQPKVNYYDLILQCPDLIPITVIAKDYGMSASALNLKLNKLDVQYKQGGRWYLYAKYSGQGYAQSKTHEYTKQDGSTGASVHLYWTQKGRIFIYDLLKAEGILPVIEREQGAS